MKGIGALTTEVSGQQEQEFLEVRVQRAVQALLNAEVGSDGRGLGPAQRLGDAPNVFGIHAGALDEGSDRNAFEMFDDGIGFDAVPGQELLVEQILNGGLIP